VLRGSPQYRGSGGAGNGLPGSAALVGVLFLGEAFGAVHVVAFGLGLSGLLLATWPEGA